MNTAAEFAEKDQSWDLLAIAGFVLTILLIVGMCIYWLIGRGFESLFGFPED